MDWRSVNFDWNRARALLVTAEEGSFSAAARALGLSQPTVGRQVAALEEELGVALLERVGHGHKLTDTGLELVEHLRAMAEAAGRVSMAAAGQSQALDGVVRVTAGEVVVAYVLPPLLLEIRQRYPGIELELIATNETRDLRAREADIALRSYRPTDPELIARKVREDKAFLYASRCYLERLGWPDTPEALSQADFIGFDRGEALMSGLNAMGLSLTPKSFPVLSEGHLAQWELVKRGLGVGIMLEAVGEAEPLVARALPSFPAFPVEMWLTCHRELHTSRRLRAVFDVLAAGLGGGG